MPRFQNSKRLITVAIAIVFAASPLIGQKRTGPRKPPAQAPAPAPKPVAPVPAPTFDALLAADSYRIYAEIRTVGQLIRSPAVTDLLDPLIKGGSPDEFKTLLKWLNGQSDALAGSRMLVASWAAQPNLPTVLIAVEFASAEEAEKFDPKLRRFAPSLLPTPTPTPQALPGDESGPVAIAAQPSPQPASSPPPPPYHIKQAGTLVLISDKPFSFRDLAPRGSRLLSEDQNFATARNRFASESIFVYVDVKSIEKEQEAQQKRYEEERNKYEAERKEREIEAANRPTPEVVTVESELEIPEPSDDTPSPVESMPEVSPSAEVVIRQPNEEASAPPASVLSTSSGPDPALSLYSLFFGGGTNWPEAVAAGIAFEGDAYVLRTLILNGSDGKGTAIPFVPQFISGPALVPESPNIFPDDADLFVSVSLDYPQIYEAMLKALARMDEMAKKYGGRPASAPTPESPFTVYEKKFGIKIKDDVLPLLGNEMALALVTPGQVVKDSSPSTQPSPEIDGKKGPPVSPPDPSPVIAIAVKDRDAVKQLIPKLIESFGLKGANLLAQTEKREDTELTSYAGVFSYAFVGNFLVVSPDPVATRHTVDYFLSHQTLSSNSHFRNSIHWQPRQLLGQVYVAPDLVERYFSLAIIGAQGNDNLRDYWSRMRQGFDPLSYVLTDDGLGPLHELHIPKTMLTLMVAGLVKDEADSSLRANESIARAALRNIVSAEATFQSTNNDHRFGSLDELIAANLIQESQLKSNGYRFAIVVSGSNFEATAVPLEYGQTGRISFFIDETSVLRGSDHGGGNATLADQPLP